MSLWNRALSVLDVDALNAVIAGDAAAIRLSGFASPRECAAFRDAADAARVSRRAATTSPMELIGANLSNLLDGTKADYFERARDATRDLRAIAGRSFDPVARVVEALAASWPGAVAVAEEGAPFGQYFAGCIKTRVKGSALHFDFAPHVAHGYRIAGLREQLAWNLYLSMPDASGHTTVYPKPVSRDSAPPGVAGKPNLVPPEQVAGTAGFTFKAAVGDLVLFNSRHPHEIVVEDLAPGERRMQIGGFAGVMPDGEMVLWS